MAWRGRHHPTGLATWIRRASALQGWIQRSKVAPAATPTKPVARPHRRALL